MPVWLQIAIALISFCSFIGPILLWFGYWKAKLEEMAKSRNELQTDLKASTAEARTLTATVISFSESQKIINQFTADALKAIVQRLEKIEERLNNVKPSH